MKYKIIVPVTVKLTFNVEANNKREAIEKIINQDEDHDGNEEFVAFSPVDDWSIEDVK